MRAGLNFTLTTQVGDIDIFGDIAGGGAYDDLLPHTIRARALEAIAALEALRDERNRMD